MAAAHRRLRAAVEIEAGHLEGRDRHRQLLDGDVVNPREGGRRRPQLCDVLVRHHHDAAPLERLRNGQAGVRRMRKRRAGIGVRQRFRPRHVGNVEDEQAVMPVADIEAVTQAQRMMAARRHPVAPRIWFSAGLPLTGNPPSAGLDRIRQIDGGRGSSRCCRRSRRRSATYRHSGRRIVAMHAAACGEPLADQFRAAGRETS